MATATRERAGALTPYQVRRYRPAYHHAAGWERGGSGALLDSRVLIIGAGGLGSPVAIYLALAGIGTLGIVDYDVVDVTNLQRQILHHDADIGRSKVESARETLLAYNPDLEVATYEEAYHVGECDGDDGGVRRGGERRG